MRLSAATLALEGSLYTRLRARADARLAALARAEGRRPKPLHLLTGERGEAAAFFHLRAHGYTIIARRWQSFRLRGDLDLVAWDGPSLVVFEIKTRTRRDAYAAELEVDRDKRTQLRRLAAAFRRQLPPGLRDATPIRFDVLSVHLPAGTPHATPAFDHLPDAFPFAAPPSEHPRPYIR